MPRSAVSPDLVGRQSQMAQLVDALQHARSGVPGIVLVRGEAGAGKTRLVREFLSVARAPDTTTLFGGCVEVSAGHLPFVPLRVAFRRLIQDLDEQPRAELLATTWRGLHMLLPDLAQANDAADGAPDMHLFEVVASVITALGHQGCVVLVVDDAQWADQSTLELLRYLVGQPPPLPLLILVAYRGEELPEDAGRRKAFEELNRSAVSSVDVGPLTRDQVVDLVGRLGHDLDADSLRQLLDRSSGLPFLVEELVAAQRDGLTRGIPTRVRDVLRMRLGGLPAAARQVVEVLAVAGRPMTHQVVRDATGLPSEELSTGVDTAQAAHLLVEDWHARTYGFRHDLAREIVHDDLRTATRLELHGRLAAALESALPPGAYATRLCEVAYHWAQTGAHEATALRAALRAARASTAARAHPEAARQYEMALALWHRVDDPATSSGVTLVTVCEEAAEAAHWAGAPAEALRHIDRALEVSGEADQHRLAMLHDRRSHYLWLQSGRLSRGPELLSRIGPAATRERMRASDLMQAGRYAESVEVALHAVELARRAGSIGDEIRASIILGVGLSFTGHPEAGLKTIEGARQQAMREGSTEEVVAAHINLTFVLLGDGQAEQAAEVALAGLAEAIKRGVGGSDSAILAGNAAEALARLGRLPEAAKLVQDGLDHHPTPALATFLLLTGAEVDVLRGRLPQAAAALDDIGARGHLDDFQFRQQTKAVEAELQLWDPSAGATALLGDLRSGLGSAIADDAGTEDVLLSARLLWLGIRADAEALAAAEIARDDERAQELVADGRRLQARMAALAAGNLSAGVRRQLSVFSELTAGELSRLSAEPDPDAWDRAAHAAADEPYLRAYALWRRGSALREVRRRREAGAALREAFRIADGSGMSALADAVVAAGHALGSRVDEAATRPRPRPAARPFNLTAKEIDVLQLLVQGRTNRRIASALRMTEKTASVHVSHILAKLAVSSRGAAVARAYEVGLAKAPASTGD